MNEDGGGSVSFAYSVASDFIPGFGERDDPALNEESEKLKKQLEAEGIEVSHTSVLDINDRRVYSADFTFNDDTALNATGFFNLDAEFIIKTGKILIYERTINPSNISGERISEDNAKKLSHLFRDEKFVFSLKMPGPVTETNGEVSEDLTAVKWEYSLGDIILMQEPIKLTAKCETGK
ncbi:MAG: hypothetical protein GY771_02475 [bacterium]|nr:hypothetical protein [bacterium]